MPVKVGNERRIPFEITADPFYSEENINHLRWIIVVGIAIIK